MSRIGVWWAQMSLEKSHFVPSRLTLWIFVHSSRMTRDFLYCVQLLSRMRTALWNVTFLHRKRKSSRKFFENTPREKSPWILMQDGTFVHFRRELRLLCRKNLWRLLFMFYATWPAQNARQAFHLDFRTSTKLSFAVGFFHNTATWSTWYNHSYFSTKEVHFLIFEKSIGTEGGLCQSCYTIDLLYRSPSLQLYFSEFAVGKT